MKEEIKNLPASVRARLENLAKSGNRPFEEVMQYYGMERFLYRLSRSQYADKLILKGALMFAVWGIPGRRTTQDIDLSAGISNREQDITAVLRSICKVQVPDDGLKFDAESIRTQRIKVDADYEGVRAKFLGYLERARIPMQIDFGFGDVIHPKAKMIDYPVLLDFPKPHLKGYTAESVISEKFEAMVNLGLLNSRMKDFYDLYLMLHQYDFNGENLATALTKTFSNRKIALPEHKPIFAEEIYDEESDRQTLWTAFLIKGDIKHAPDKLGAAALEIEKFLIEPLEAIGKKREFKRSWKAPGPWK